ncbi:hypothetical protein C1646_770959 [Rhizophagus diaphanus]|nr:hypothetical protein C1646_770959 [Rhizophagus diaphanus] [Rhizophagus sp. MUCL 43196]
MGIGQELAKVAIHIHSICINSASVEHLWSSMEVNQADQQMKQLHIATPIALNNFDYLNDKLLQNIINIEDSNDENFLNDDLVNDFSVGTRNIHPADDTNAKWQLSTLFISILKPPVL